MTCLFESFFIFNSSFSQRKLFSLHFRCQLRCLLHRRCCDFFLAVAASSSPVFEINESSSSRGACSSLPLEIVYWVLFCVLVCIGVACVCVFVYCCMFCSSYLSCFSTHGFFFFVKKSYGLSIHIGFSKKYIFSVSEKSYGLTILMSFFFNI